MPFLKPVLVAQSNPDVKFVFSIVEEVFDCVQTVATEEDFFPFDNNKIAVAESDHTTKVLHGNLLLVSG
jgi:hypothetical protein